MTEAVRRVRDGHGSDIVRRLIARPIRMDRVPLALPPIEAEREDEGGEGAGGAGEFERLRAEMAIMKAALALERSDGADLRARVRHVGRSEPLGEEALATRDRWAALVDDLLRARI